MTPSLYIHIPFCRRRCVYCNFYSAIYEEGLAASYISVLAAQLERISDTPSTIYIGGGTPTVLSDRMLEKLLKSVKAILPGLAEFTVEANPESLDRNKLKLLRDNGVNRLSIGLQSLSDVKLKKLGRLHNARKAEDCVRDAVKAGFGNISVDLIFGIWGEDAASFRKELGLIARLPVTHVSCYELTYEKNTPLFSALANKSIVPLEDNITAVMYETAIDMLSLGGFKQYEVSNFAKIGFECRHNLNYWDNNPYIGLGASAVSYIDGVRSKFVSDVKEYTNRFQRDKSLIESSEKLSPARRARETAAIKIRTRAGIDFKWFKDKTGYDFCEFEKKALPRLIEDGFIKYKKDGGIPAGIVLKRKGFLYCDTVSSSLL